ncbi:MAG: RNA-binding protein [Salinibacterium sp.]|nr:RNA-binding protein [Salinibacterium sp.]
MTPVEIFVSNYPWATTDAELKTEFERHGLVDSIRLITDRETGRSRGFGFVTMPNTDEANAAIAALHGSDFGGRSLNVRESRDKTNPRAKGGRRTRASA